MNTTMVNILLHSELAEESLKFGKPWNLLYELIAAINKVI